MSANPLARAEKRRAAKMALRAALAGLDNADKLALLEDELAEMYAPRVAVREAQIETEKPPPLALRSQPTQQTLPSGRAVRPGSLPEKILNVLAHEPTRTFTTQEVCEALPGEDAQKVRTELNRQAHNGALDHPAHGRYRMRASNGAAKGGADEKHS